MRYTIQKKIIFLGAFLSFLLLSGAFITSFFIYRYRSNQAFINSIDNSIKELESTVGDDDTLNSIRQFYDAFIMVYNEHKNDDLSNIKTNDEKKEYYTNTYDNIYSSGVGFGLSYQKVMLQNAYLDVSSKLSNAQVSAGSPHSYIGFFPDDKRFVYLFDSKFNLKDCSGDGFYCGEQYFLNEDDLDLDPNIKTGGYVINGKTARVIDFEIGKDENDIPIIITAFIEYDNQIVTNDLKFFSLVLGLTLAGILIILIFIYILIARIVIIKNLKILTNSVNEFTENIRNGKASDVIESNIKSSDEIGLLSDSYNTMAHEIIEYTKKIEKATREQERIEAELQIATNIQLESLPKNSLNDSNILLNASIKSAKEVGGDFYDYFYIDKNNLAIIVSDVSGKGIPAALFMMKAKELIKSKLLSNMNLANVAFMVNNELLINNEEGLFITAFIGILNIESKKLEVINCGHERPYLIRDGKVSQLQIDSNFILGGIDDYEYKTEIISLKENDRLFIHTDGLNESINSNNIEFGYERILDSLSNSINNRLEDILISMDEELNKFTDNSQLFDDVTMVILEIKTPKLNFKFKNPDYEIIELVTNKFNDYYSYIDKDNLSKINIVIDEVLNNYISYEKKEDLIIEIEFEYINNQLVVKFLNNGEEFNPLLMKDNYIEEYSDDLKLGGFGITIIKNITDDLYYERKDDRNIFIIKKNV